MKTKSRLPKQNVETEPDQTVSPDSIEIDSNETVWAKETM